MKRFLLGLIIATLLTAVVFFALLPAEKYFLESMYQVLPIPGVKQPLWIETFMTVGIYCLLISLGFTVFWILVGFLFYRIIDWKKAGGREFWLGLGVLMVFVLPITGYFLNFQTQDIGRYVASVFYAFNGVLVYWITSLLQSPSNVKYAPFGAIQIYRLGFINKLLN